MLRRNQNALQGLVVSDLHLLAHRSDGIGQMEALTPRLPETDLLVLNGDIFDFRWSTRPGHSESIRDAVQWLRDLMASAEACQIHYVLGNHDCLVEFLPELERLADESPNFNWHEYTVQLGDALFLHGDCTHRRMDFAALKKYRDDWSRDEQRHGPATVAYQMADRLGMTRLMHHLHSPRKRTLRRLTHHLDLTMENWRESIRHCYFGHTHEPFSDVDHEGVRFHNTGCAIRGMRFGPTTFEVSEHKLHARSAG